MAGRPRKRGKREPSGRISRASGDNIDIKMALEAGTWKRRQMNAKLSVDEARMQEHGSVIHAWRQKAIVREKDRQPGDEPDPNRFTSQQFNTALDVQMAYERYCMAMGLRSPRSASDFSGPGGYDGKDPFDPERAERDERAVRRWKEIRRAVLESGSLGMMAVEAIIIENKSIPRLIGDLRAAMNEVARLNQRRKAA